MDVDSTRASLGLTGVGSGASGIVGRLAPGLFGHPAHYHVLPKPPVATDSEAWDLPRLGQPVDRGLVDLKYLTHFFHRQYLIIGCHAAPFPLGDPLRKNRIACRRKGKPAGNRFRNAGIQKASQEKFQSKKSATEPPGAPDLRHRVTQQSAAAVNNCSELLCQARILGPNTLRKKRSHGTGLDIIVLGPECRCRFGRKRSVFGRRVHPFVQP